MTSGETWSISLASHELTGSDDTWFNACPVCENVCEQRWLYPRALDSRAVLKALNLSARTSQATLGPTS